MKEVCKIRVIFGDTDAMGIAYYGTYFRWFEMGRVELLRQGGLEVRELTDRDVHLPVVRTECKYSKPARYDDEITIFTGIKGVRKVRLAFSYRIESNAGVLTHALTEHVFTDRSGKVIRPPADIISRIGRVIDA